MTFSLTNVPDIVSPVVISTTGATLNWSNLGEGRVDEYRITLSSPLSISMTGGRDGGFYRLTLIQDSGGGKTVTWSSEVDFTNFGSTPILHTTANATDILLFLYDLANNKYRCINHVGEAPGVIRSNSFYATGLTTGLTSSGTQNLNSFTLSGAGNISVGFNNGSWIVSGSNPIPAASIGISATGNTAGSTSSMTTPLTAISLSGSLGASVGFSGGTWIIAAPTTVAQSAQTLGLFAVGNTAGSTSSQTLDARTISFVGSGIASVGYSNGSIVISAPATVATNPFLSLYAVSNTTASTTSGNNASGSLSLAGAGIVSVGLSNSSYVISASVAAQTAPALNIYASGNTTNSTTSGAIQAGSLSFNGSGAVSVGISGSSVIISAPATIAQTVQTIGGFATGLTTGSSSSTTFDARSFTVSGAGIASVGYSSNNILIVSVPSPTASGTIQNRFATGNTTGDSSSAVGTLSSLKISGAGAVSVGYDTNVSGALIISSPVAIASGTVLNRLALGNTTGQTSSSTATLSNVSYSGAGGVSVGFSTTGVGAGVFIISGATTAASATSMTMVAIGNTTGSSSATTRNITAETFSGLGIVSVGFSGNSILISASTAATNPLLSLYAVGNTTSSTTSSPNAAGSLSFAGAGLVSVGISGSSVVISASTAATQFSRLEPSPFIATSTSTWPLGTLAVIPFDVQGQLSFNQVVGLSSRSLLQTVGGFNNGATTTSNRLFTQAFSYGSTASYIIYSRQTGASSNSFSSFSSTSALHSIQLGVTGTVGTGTALSLQTKTLSATISLAYPIGSLTSSASFSSSTTATSSLTINYAAAGLTASSLFQSYLNHYAPFAASLPAGDYLIGQMWSTGSTSGTTGAFAVNTTMSIDWPATNVVITEPALGVRIMNATTTTSPFMGIGSTSSAGSAIPSTIPWQGLSIAVSDPQPYLYFVAGS